MGLLTDILKEIPQAAVLKEKIATIEAKYAASDTENAILKDDLREAKAEIAKLKNQVEELSHKELHDTEIEILRRIVLHSPDNSFLSVMFQEPGISREQRERLTYHATNLETCGYIEGGYIDEDFGEQYSLTQKGREALIAKNII
jgi:predicted RNase H-like nuclease (RuvC/YqgF family)